MVRAAALAWGVVRVLRRPATSACGFAACAAAILPHEKKYPMRVDGGRTW